MTLQPFFNYNFPGGWYFSSSPIITANWIAESSRDVWIVPTGGRFGKIIHFGRLPVNLSFQAFYKRRDASIWRGLVHPPPMPDPFPR